jgi:hypothetical protein
MDKVIWLVTGNKGGVGKSVVAKSLVEWLKCREVSITVVDGDMRTLDVARVFETLYRTEKFNLRDETGWRLFSDALCQSDIEGHVVINLPDGIDDQSIQFFDECFITLMDGYRFQVKVLFVINTLPDGLIFFARMTESFPKVIPVKNLHFGTIGAFGHFTCSQVYEDRTIFFPAMNPRIMQVVRESNLSFSEFARQAGDSKSNFIYAKIIVADWFDNMREALDDILLS